MKRLLIGSALTLSTIIAAAVEQDQPTPIQYVASVKRNTTGGGLIRLMPGNLSITGMPVRILIRLAFGQLQDFQLVGGPGWTNSDRFDIEAKLDGAGPPPGPQFVQDLLRTLLEDRFKLKTHKETRDVPIFALVLARADGRLGPKLSPSSDECAAFMSARGRGRGGPGPDARGGPPPDGRGGPPVDGRGGPPRLGGPGPLDFDGPIQCGQRMGGFGRIRAGGNSMEQFANLLSSSAQRIVIDKTGLTGYYDISLTYTPTPDQMPQGQPPPGAPPLTIDPDGPSLFTAIQEQLGLKLQDQRGPVEVVVIDSISAPTEN